MPCCVELKTILDIDPTALANLRCTLEIFRLRQITDQALAFRNYASDVADRYRQIVPRPKGGEVRILAPWSTTHAATVSHVTIDVVRIASQRLAETLASSQEQDVHLDAAVLIPLFESGGECHLVLTRRADHLGEDPGHLAFPGGHIETNESPVNAALREATEEIGLDVDLLDTIVPLGTFVRPHKSDCIAGYAAFLRRRPELLPCDAEVDSIFEVPIAGLLAQGVAWAEDWGSTVKGAISGEGHDGKGVAFFANQRVLGDNLLWGLTARIAWVLLAETAKVLNESVCDVPIESAFGACYE